LYVYRFSLIFFVYRFTFGFRLFRVFFCGDCASQRGGWNNTRWPQNMELRWLHASRLSSCGLSFYRSFFFFPLSFSFNSSLLLHSSGNRTAKSVPFPFHSRDLPERYFLLFFSPTFFPLFVCIQPMRSCGKWLLPSNVKYARTHRHFTATT
jgi:hypothetical protein